MSFAIVRQRVSRLILPLVLATTLMNVAVARDLGTDPDDLVAVELATVGLDRMSGAPLVLLREPKSGDVVPIMIGMAEAQSILMAMHEVAVPRPMTHDLMGALVSATDARLKRVFVDDLVDGTYLGMLELELDEGRRVVLVDTRPSDGLALAMRTGATIHVAPKILRAGDDLEFEGLEDDQVVTAIGVTVVEATGELREAMALPDTSGVLVSRTTGAAAEAGIAPGSLIVEVNDQAPEAPMDFLDLVRQTPSGEKARIRYWHEGEEREAELSTDVPDTGMTGEEPLRSL